MINNYYTRNIVQKIIEYNFHFFSFQNKKRIFFSFSQKEIYFNDDVAQLIDAKGNRKRAKRQALEGLWVEYAWSVSNSAIHIRFNRIQIDNQLDTALFPVILHPVTSKISANEYTEKPFIELSILETKTARSNIRQFKYFKLLVQEYAVKIDQGFIVAVLAFFRPESVRFTNYYYYYLFFLLSRIEFCCTNNKYGY